MYARCMKLDVNILLPGAAVAASLLLLFAGRKRVWEIVALVASAAWLLIVLHVFAWPFRSVSHSLVIGGTLIVCGVVVHLRTKNKREVTASTVLAILGGVLVVGALGLLRI